MAEYRFIDRVAEVEELASKLALEKVVAVDTEADSFFHYFDKLCLLQISASCGTFLIDPLSMPPRGLEPLAPVMLNPAIRKVFHAADYDLFVLSRHCGITVRGLFDTMISAQMLGYPAVGLGALVERHFGVKLSKDQQRTDWSLRALKPAQLNYAASDVIYLIELAQTLERELTEKKRLAWAKAEFAALEQRLWPEREFDMQGYLRIKGARKLTPRGIAVLRELYLWRDKRARELDKPPFKVMGNGTLLDLAQSPPGSRRALGMRKGISEQVLRRQGQELLEAIERGTDGPEHPPLERKQPTGEGRRRLDRRGESRLDELKLWRAKRAGELGLDPGVFCPNASLEEIAAVAPKRPEELSGLTAVKPWWIEQFGPEVLKILSDSDAPAATAEVPKQTRAQAAPDPESGSPEQVPRKRSRRSRRGSRGGRRRR